MIAHHLIFEDWNKSIERQSFQWNHLIKHYWPQIKSTLDVSCGIGTQTLGLAHLEYELTSSDLSSNQIKRTTSLVVIIFFHTF